MQKKKESGWARFKYILFIHATTHAAEVYFTFRVYKKKVKRPHARTQHYIIFFLFFFFTFHLRFRIYFQYREPFLFFVQFKLPLEYRNIIVKKVSKQPHAQFLQIELINIIKSHTNMFFSILFDLYNANINYFVKYEKQCDINH